MAEKSNARRASEIWPSDVLLRMWPPDKVGTGMQVCRYLRCELTKVPVVVVNVEPRRGGALQAEHLARGLMRLSGHVHLQIPATLPGTQLIDILLTASTMGWTGPQSLQQALSTVRQDADKIGVEGAQKLGLFFARCLHLRHLTLSGHSIRDEGAVVLVPALLEHAAATLEGLDLRDNYLSDVSAAVFADGLPLCPKLKTLDMSDNNICVQGAEQLGSSIHKCTSLTALCMGGNNISAKGAGHLVAALAAKGSALTTLDLRGNNIWDEGVRMIADYLPRFACLQTLNLRGNKVGVWGATSIAHVLPQCRALQHLDLGGNWLGDEGASRIASCLCLCSSTLSLVGLTWNNIRIEGLHAVEKASANASAEVVIDLSWNPATMLRGEGGMSIQSGRSNEMQ